jgi:hypothetical protein
MKLKKPKIKVAFAFRDEMKKLLKASCQKTKKNVDHILFNNFLILSFFFCYHYNWCFLKFGVEESIVNAPPNYNSDQLFTSYLNFCMFLICSLTSLTNQTSGSFTIDSTTPTWTPNLKNTLYAVSFENATKQIRAKKISFQK